MYILNNHIQMAVPSMLYFLLRRWSNSKILFAPCFFFDIPRNIKELATNYRQEATHKTIREAQTENTEKRTQQMKRIEARQTEREVWEDNDNRTEPESLGF